MRAKRRAALLAVTAWVTIGVGAAGLPGAVGAAPGADVPSPCALTTGKWADPTRLYLGDWTTVTLTSTTACPSEVIPVHVVLSLDVSRSMTGQKLPDAKKAAIRFVQRMDFAVSMAGVTSFGDGSRIDAELSDSAGRIIGILNGLDMWPTVGTDIVGALQDSHTVLKRGRVRNRDGKPAPIEVVILLSDGRPYPSTPQQTRQAANRLKSDDVLLVTICVGGDCDQQLMRDIASRSDLYFDVQESAGLSAVYERLARQLLDIRLKQLIVRDHLPTNMVYLPGSAAPEPDTSEPGWLTWTYGVVPAERLTITYRVEPQQVGLWPTNVEALASFRDSENRIGEKRFPVPVVEVLLPPTPTATSSPTRTPTATASPMPTGTATASPTASPTPTAPPGPIFLPLLLGERCKPEEVSTDVVLVLDTSTSMDEPTRDGGTAKRNAAREAARTFVGLLRPGRDRVAVVAFDETARTLAPLSADPAPVLAALERLPRGMGTRIDAGLDAAREALTRERPWAGVHPAVVLLTDGRPTRSSEADVLAAAERLGAANITVFVVGLGADVNPDLLRAVAGAGDRYFPAADTDDLTRIYRTLAWTIPCPGSFWPRHGPELANSRGPGAGGDALAR